MVDQPARRLILVPVVHSQADMGRLREAVRDQHVARHGERHWDGHVRAVEAFWAGVGRAVDSLGLDPRRVRVYQDGLPVCGRERAIVEDLAAAGSENHRLVAGLVARGAALEGTEDPALLLREYELAVQMLGRRGGAAVTPEVAREFERLGRELLDRRDRFIAGRVNATLRPGETGLVFLGMLHAPQPYLAADVRVDRLDPAPAPAPAPA